MLVRDDHDQMFMKDYKRNDDNYYLNNYETIMSNFVLD